MLECRGEANGRVGGASSRAATAESRTFDVPRCCRCCCCWALTRPPSLGPADWAAGFSPAIEGGTETTLAVPCPSSQSTTFWSTSSALYWNNPDSPVRHTTGQSLYTCSLASSFPISRITHLPAVLTCDLQRLAGRSIDFAPKKESGVILLFFFYFCEKKNIDEFWEYAKLFMRSNDLFSCAERSTDSPRERSNF